LNHRAVVAAVRRFLETQKVDFRTPVAVLAVIWGFNLLSVSRTLITITPAGEEYLAAFGGDS
jgi:hypothetical protein